MLLVPPGTMAMRRGAELAGSTDAGKRSGRTGALLCSRHPSSTPSSNRTYSSVWWRPAISDLSLAFHDNDSFRCARMGQVSR